MKKLFIIISFIAFITISITNVYSQPLPPFPDKPDPTPITGLEILAIAGGGYGIKKLRDKNKNKT